MVQIVALVVTGWCKRACSAGHPLASHNWCYWLVGRGNMLIGSSGESKRFGISCVACRWDDGIIFKNCVSDNALNKLHNCNCNFSVIADITSLHLQ